MKRERQAILSLVALGRITPRDAERLLAAWNAGREELWVMAALVVGIVVQGLPEIARLAHQWMSLRHGLAALLGWI